ncbi:MAG: site-specific integrase [Gammaproteobacteria bacterium]|nr:site-specific integrase [Gammaproteobacteria bacterium]
MASIENRSRYVVAVEGEIELSLQFPYYALAAARARLSELRKLGKHAQLTQGQDNLLIRFRDKGYPRNDVPAASYEEADRIIKQVAADRAAGRRRIDYHRAHHVTFAELFDRYMIEVCPLHKGCEVERRVLNSFLLDIGYESSYEKERRAARISRGLHAEARRRSIGRTDIEWLEKPFSDVGPEDLQRYAHARIAQGIRPATVDKELDLMSQVVAWAQDTKNFDLEKSPFKGLRRPRYHNERDRRVEGDELERLLAAAREEDRRRSLKPVIEATLRAERAEWLKQHSRPMSRGTAWARRKVLLDRPSDALLHVPFYEALLQFLLLTGVRRRNVLQLLWEDVDLEGRKALHPDTKNGRPHYSPLRARLVELLRQLPRNDKEMRVFPISETVLKDAWARIKRRAGITDLHLHDLRHEAISSVAEVTREAGMPMNLLDLQAFSGHKDVKSLARYTHTLAGPMADWLDEAFRRAEARGIQRKGRVRVTGFGPPAGDPAHAPRAHESLTPASSDTEPTHAPRGDLDRRLN